MAESEVVSWLAYARELQALGQTITTFARNVHDRKNGARLQEIAAEIVAAHTSLEAAPLLETFTAQPGYATPKIDVRGAVIRTDRILLVQERQDECWCMPGGWADVGATPAAMVVREVAEESGLRVEPIKLVGVWDANRGGQPESFFHAYKVVMICREVSGEPAAGDETMAAAFFSFDELPQLSLARTNPQHLAEVRAHLRDPQRPAAFD
jgi:ADP-ribose pyrophosphatase YjhB (NUDIX family)